MPISFCDIKADFDSDHESRNVSYIPSSFYDNKVVFDSDHESHVSYMPIRFCDIKVDFDSDRAGGVRQADDLHTGLYWSTYGHLQRPPHHHRSHCVCRRILAGGLVYFTSLVLLCVRVKINKRSFEPFCVWFFSHISINFSLVIIRLLLLGFWRTSSILS